MGYTPTTWSEGTAPGISATQLNRIETGVDELWRQVRDIAAYTTDHTLDATDAGKIVKVTKATSVALTVPPNSSVPFPVGQEIEVMTLGAGTLTIVAGSGVTIRVRTGLSLILTAQYAVATLVKIATDEWVIAGDLLPA